MSLHMRLFGWGGIWGYPDKNRPLVGVRDDGKGDKADAERNVNVAFHIVGVGVLHCLA